MIWRVLLIPIVLLGSGCTVKAIGDPNRPITIEAHVTIDVKGLKDTAADIEDYVSGKDEKIPVTTGKK